MAAQDSMHWTGRGFLAQIGGDAKRFPPTQVVFLVQRLGASGRLWLTRGADIRTLDFSDGAIVGCSGFPELLTKFGVSGERQDTLNALVDRATEGGASREEVLHSAAVCLGISIIDFFGDEDLMVQFAPDAPGSTEPVILPLLPVQMVVEGVRKKEHQAETREWITAHSQARIAAWEPSDSPSEQWGLDDATLDMLKSAKAAEHLGALGASEETDMLGVAVLRYLGLLALAQGPQVSALPDESPEDTEEEAPSQEAKRARFDRPQGASRNTERAKGGRKRRTRGGALADIATALQRIPWESPPDDVENHLKAAYDAIGASRPEVALNILKTDDLVIEMIEQRYREACARYHPDRYLSTNQAIRSLAEGCFSRISEAYHLIKDPAAQQQIRERMVFAETGQRPVTQKTRSRARVDFKRAEILFRQRRFKDAAVASQRALRGDPERWEYAFLHLRSAWHGGAMDTEAAVTGILELQDMGAAERGEMLFVAGEMMLKDGRKKEAFALYRQAVEMDANNVGAQRRIRLAGRRKEATQTQKKPERRVFGGLFGRRKE